MRMLIFQTESDCSKKRCFDVQDWGKCAGLRANTVVVSGHFPRGSCLGISTRLPRTREAPRMSSESTCPLVLLEPGFPTDRAGGLLRAGIAPLTQGAGSFARQEERDDGTMDPPLLEPHAR